MLFGLAVPAPQAWAADALPATQASAASREASRRIYDFNIPAQALDSALEQYAAVSGRAAVFRSSLIAGKRSAPVSGSHTAEAALRLLVSEAGLEVEEVDSQPVPALVLRSSQAARDEASGAAGRQERQAQEHYDGLVQAGIWQALCAQAETAQPDYRALLRVGIDAAGRVRQARLLTSSGDEARDAVLLRAVQRVRLGDPPPPGMPQPLTLLIQAQGASGAPVCAEGGR